MILNRKQFFEKLRIRLGEVPIKNAKRACFKAANLVKNDAIKSIMQGSKTGGTVRKYNPNRTHTQSAAGEPPASDTGFLVSNITADVERTGTGFSRRVTGIVTASAPYAIHLEFGTYKMQARPFLQPALDRNAKKIRDIFIKEGIIS